MINRTIYTVSMQPVLGSRFQPTGFPDLGPAVFARGGADSEANDALLVESVQSMANWAEATTWDVGQREQTPELSGLPYVRVVGEDGSFLTSSRLEAHRLASAYIMEGSIDGVGGEPWFQERFGLVKGQPLDNARLAAEVLRLDPLSLIHGVFFARGKWPWQPKVARVLTCFIEADGVREAVSGGVKKDSVEIGGADTARGFGMVPHQRVEFTARSITAYVSIDRDQVRSFGLGAAGSELLEAVAEFEVASLFAGGLRLRTACDLEVAPGTDPGLPTPESAAARVRAAIDAAADLLGPVREVIFTSGSGRAKKG